ncbi:MAG TPA: DJ-1/PfpI family protein [Candidatus Dorea intestinavium]|nr:DJ-1/PfpI family protein [Candidatus Dorea intestinavium]
MMKKVCVLLAEGFEEVEALTAVDLLRRAQIYVDTVSIEEGYGVSGAHGILVQTEDLFQEVDFSLFDMIVLPGGMPGTRNLEMHKGVKQVINEYNNNNKLIAAICAAPTILGKMGLLKGRKATCYPGMEEELHGAVVSSDSVCVDGNIITSRGVGTAIDFALRLIAILVNEEKAGEIADAIVY